MRERGIRVVRRRWIGAVLAAGLVVASAERAVAQVEIPPGWEIVTVGDGEEFLHGVPDINDRGDIVFTRWGDPADHSTREIFMYTSGELIQLTDDDIKDGFPAINNNQGIAWMRDLRGGFLWAIVYWRNGELEVISDLPHAEGIPDINRRGHIVWGVELEGGPETAQLFFYDGMDVRQITNNGLSNQSARINDNSLIVWTRYNFFDNPWTSEIMMYDAETDRTMQLSDGQGQMQEPAVSDVPKAVWASPQAGVEVWDDFETFMVLDDGQQPVINDSGDIAVSRWDPECQGNSMWLILDGQLFQLTDGTEGGLSPAINQRGEVAWRSGRFPEVGVSLLTRERFVADFDFDGDIDLRDYSRLQACFGKASPLGLSCEQTDVDRNGVVNGDDYARWFAFIEGPEE